MSDTVFYEGHEHVFYNENGSQNVYLKAGMGQTLIIEGSTTNNSVGSDKQVIYNNTGVLSGSDTLAFDGVFLSALGGIKTNNVHGVGTTNALNYNEIYRGSSQICTSIQPTFKSLGTDVQMAKNVNYAIFAAPNFIPEASSGGISIWNETGSVFSEYNDSILTYTNYTSEATVKFCSINESGDLAILTSNDQEGYLTTFERIGTDWTNTYNYSQFSSAKLSNNKMLAYDYKSNFSTYTYASGIWSLEQTIMNNFLPSNYNLDYHMAIDGNRLAFSFGSNTYLWAYSIGWILQQTITSGSICLDYYNNLLVKISTSKLQIYESGVLTANITTSLINCCTNGTYVFTINASGIITIWSKIANIWTASANTTTLTSGKKMSANANYLTIGTPSIGVNGSASIFKIIPYTNSAIVINTLNLKDASNRIVIDTPASTLFNTGSVSISDITESYSATTGCLVLSGGLGISKKITAGSNIDVIGSVNLTSTSSTLIHSGTTDSTSITTGSVRLLGGLGVSKTIFATTYSSPNNAFKFSNYQASTAQSVAASVSSSVLFGTNLVEGISTLTKSLSAGGSRFTTSIACKLLVSWHFRSTGASNFGQTYILVNGTGRFLGHCNAWAQSGQGNALSSATILNLSANDFFSTFALFDNTCNISSEGTFQVSTIEIYSLN